MPDLPDLRVIGWWVIEKHAGASHAARFIPNNNSYFTSSGNAVQARFGISNGAYVQIRTGDLGSAANFEPALFYNIGGVNIAATINTPTIEIWEQLI